MEINIKLRDQIFAVIENQIKANSPPETKVAYDRLRREGFDDFQTRQLIGQCLAVELFDVLKMRRVFDHERYIRNLNRLPEEPFEEDSEEEG